MAVARQTARRPRARWWATRAIVALAVGLALALAVDAARGGITRTWLNYGRILTYDARGERVEVAPGQALYIDCRGTGTPTLVLEAGMGSDSSTWSAVHDDLAGITRTCAYDRLGRGRSDRGSAGDLAGQSRQLATLLARAGERSPFGLVGHSYGTVIARVHATLARDEVIGLVLIDGFDPDIFDTYVVPFTGAHEASYLGHSDRLWAMVASTERIDEARSREQLADSTVSGLPIEVIVAARYEAGLSDEENDRIEASRIAGYETLSPGSVTYTTAFFSGHMVQFDRPELVIEAARRIVEQLRSTGS